MSGQSGLRNPPAAVRGAGAGALAAMAVTSLLAIVPLIRLGVASGAVWLVAVLAVLSIVLIGLLRRPWAWWAALAVPAALVVGGLVWHVALTVLGVLFGLLWLYVLRVRRTVLSGAAPSA